MTLPSGLPWAVVKADWLTGAFSVNGLAQAHNIDRGTLMYRMKNDTPPWPPRPTAAIVQESLSSAVLDACGQAEADSVEAVTAALEGRIPDADRVAAERASAEAKRKAVIIRDHRDLADRYGKLASKTLKLLENYADGRFDISFVVGKNSTGDAVAYPFHLFSKQHGLIDGVGRIGTVLEMAITLQRAANGLEQVDGDGNPKRSGSSGGAGSLVDRTRSDEELIQTAHDLIASLNAPLRVSPVPPGLAADA